MDSPDSKKGSVNNMKSSLDSRMTRLDLQTDNLEAQQSV